LQTSKRMKQIVNKKYEPLFKEHPRYFVMMGGRGGGRSTVASQFAIAKLTAPEYFRCAIMRLVLGDIRNSIYREIIDRAEENKIDKSIDITDNAMILKYGENSINAVGFRKSSGDQKSKLKSLANYNCIIIEEADEIPEDDFMQLDDSLRTLKGDIVIILLLNPPPKSHWIINRWFDLFPSDVKGFFVAKLKKELTNTIFIKTNYLDNEVNMSKGSMDNYRNYKKTKPSYYYNVIEGLVPETVRGRIYKDWKEIDEIPHEAKLVRRGLDFGYTNDPSTLTDIYEYNGGYIFDERLYRKGMKNGEIAGFILALEEPDTLVIGDSAEPKSIDEISDYGVNILGAKKQKEEQQGTKQSYLKWRIGVVQDKKISYTKRSKNLKYEYENYAWMENKDLEIINIPQDFNNHCMDGIGYGVVSLLKESDTKEQDIRKIQEVRYNRATNTDAGL